MKKYKTIIIGAGPAGLRCAKILAENKEDFILFEGRPDIYRKICTGMYGLADCSLGQTDYFSLPENIFQKKINKVVLVLGKRKKEIIMTRPFVGTINRQELSTWMYQEAKNAGANIVFNSPVSEVGNNYIITNGEKIFFDYLVGADGCNSMVRKNLGLENKASLALQYWIKGESDSIEIKFDPKNLGPYYAWLAPHKDMISVGAVGSNMSLERTKSNILSYCQEKNMTVSGLNLEGALISFCYQGYHFGNKFLVGDAGGFTSGLTGEGIYPAMASGEDVARIIIDPKYQPVLIKKILIKKKKHEVVLRCLENRVLLNISIKTLFFLLNFDYFRRKAIKLIA